MENIAATLPAHRMAHALEGTMATTMASRDCEGQSEPIKEGDVGRKKKKKRSNQIVLLVTFLPALPKMCVLRLLYFIFHYLNGMQACVDCG